MDYRLRSAWTALFGAASIPSHQPAVLEASPIRSAITSPNETPVIDIPLEQALGFLPSIFTFGYLVRFALSGVSRAKKVISDGFLSMHRIRFGSTTSTSKPPSLLPEAISLKPT